MLGHGGIWLLDPIVHLPGEEFLILLIGLLVFGLIAGRIFVTWSTQSDLPNLKIPQPLDPYAIAFLRGGDTEAMRTAMVELVEGGWIVEEKPPTGLKYLLTPKTTKWKTDDSSRSTENLGPLQLLLLEHFKGAKTAVSLFEESLVSKARQINEPHRKWVIQEKLWNEPNLDPRATRWLIGIALAIEALAIYKFFHALSEHRSNVGFLVLGILATPSLFMLCALRARLSPRGKRFLGDVQTACFAVRNVKQSSLFKWKPTDPRHAAYQRATNLADDYSLSMLGMGVFGVSALQGSQLDAIYTSYQRSVSTSGGCGSAGSGSSCGGASGCGGGSSCGGGGCGGGGCGGCGG